MVTGFFKRCNYISKLLKVNFMRRDINFVNLFLVFAFTDLLFKRFDFCFFGFNFQLQFINFLHVLLVFFFHFFQNFELL